MEPQLHNRQPAGKTLWKRPLAWLLLSLVGGVLPLFFFDNLLVTMAAPPTEDLGQLYGVVSDAWTGGFTSATVELVGVGTVIANPTFHFEVEGGIYTLKAYSSYYYTHTTTVEIAGGGVTVIELQLEPALPRLEWNPAGFDLLVAAGGNYQETLTLDNSGPVTLTFAIAVEPAAAFPDAGVDDVDWLSVSPPNGAVPGHTEQALTVHIDTTNLTSGHCAAQLVITHNDPNLLSPITVPVELVVLSPAISLDVTVGLEPAVCATTTNLTIPQGTTITFCYLVTNIGDTLLDSHTLFDSKLGLLLFAEPINLLPGIEHELLVTTTIDADTTSTATWTAVLAAEEGITASAVATATVTINNNVYLPLLPNKRASPPQADVVTH